MKWKKIHLDIGNAFLEALLKEELFMYLPLDWTRGKKIKVKLCRNIYGLKQAGLFGTFYLTKLQLSMASNDPTGIPVYTY
jgi:hypothetical protein